MRALAGVSHDDLVKLHWRIDALDRKFDHVWFEDLPGLKEEVSDLQEERTRRALHARVAPTMEWIRRGNVRADVLVSVVLPTRNRSVHLSDAIASVLDQEYPNWELVVVDDGSTDDTAATLKEFEDQRIRVVGAEGEGSAGARNRGLEEARGTIIAYLDDDNRMHPAWLRSVVWALSRHPEADCLYGARIVDDPSLAGDEGDGPAAMHFEPFDRRRLERTNYIDLGTLAHRAGLPEAVFDPQLQSYVDWDLVLRLSQPRPPLSLPAIAEYYSTTADARLSKLPDHLVSWKRVQAKLGARPLRVLAYTSMYPMISETYIGEELEGLCRHGGDLAYAREMVPPADMPTARPVFEDLDRGIRAFGPDVLFVYWIGFIEEQLAELERVGLPFGLRVHSFDYDPEAARRILQHPLCIGIWAYEHHARDITGAHVLPPMLTTFDRMPDPAPRRDLVMSVSAGLPKKNWNLLFDAMSKLSGTERKVIMAVTANYEDLPEELRAKLARYDDPPEFLVNVPRDEVFGMLARAAAVVYTLDPQKHFGNPMSVVEGMCAGASVILPDRPEAREFAPPTARFYTDADGIAGHVREVLAGGPEVQTEQAANRAFGINTFCDESVGKRFHQEVAMALARFRERRETGQRTELG